MAGSVSPPARTPHPARTAALYTLGRFAVFGVVTGALFAIGVGLVAVTGHPLDWRGLQPVLLAAAFIGVPVSMLVSYFALRRQREALAGAIEQRWTGYRARLAARTAAEDAYVDQLLAAQRDGHAADDARP